MFPRPQRLTEKKSFDTLFRRGSWVRGRLFNLVFMPTSQGKIGFIITKKVTKSAVERNRLKRRVRGAFQAAVRQEKFAPLVARYNIIVLMHTSRIDRDFASLLKEVEGQLERLMAASGKRK